MRPVCFRLILGIVRRADPNVQEMVRARVVAGEKEKPAHDIDIARVFGIYVDHALNTTLFYSCLFGHYFIILQPLSSSLGGRLFLVKYLPNSCGPHPPVLSAYNSGSRRVVARHFSPGPGPSYRARKVSVTAYKFDFFFLEIVKGPLDFIPSSGKDAMGYKVTLEMRRGSKDTSSPTMHESCSLAPSSQHSTNPCHQHRPS